MDGAQIGLGLEYLLYKFAVLCVSQRYGEMHGSQVLTLLQRRSSTKKSYNFKTSRDTFLKNGFLV